MFLRAVEVESVILFIEKPINNMYEVQRTTLRDGGFSRNTGLWVRINAHDVNISRHSQRAVLSVESSWASRHYSASGSTIPYSMKNQLHASLPTSRLLLCSLNFLMQNLGCVLWGIPYTWSILQSEKLIGEESFTERGKTWYAVYLSLNFSVDAPYLWSQHFCLESQV